MELVCYNCGELFYSWEDPPVLESLRCVQCETLLIFKLRFNPQHLDEDEILNLAQ